jgi:hypothetical protein
VGQLVERSSHFDRHASWYVCPHGVVVEPDSIDS